MFGAVEARKHLAQHQRGDQAAGPGTDHDDRDLDIEDGFGGGQDRHG
jgi:hypothetical protein